MVDKTTKGRYFLSVFTILFLLMEIYFYHHSLYLEEKQHIKLAHILIFDALWIETGILLLCIIFLFRTSLFLRSIVWVLLLIYIGIHLTQMISIVLSGEFVSRLAVSNVEFIDLLLTWDNIRAVLRVLVIYLGVPLLMAYFLSKVSWLYQTRRIFFVMVIFLITVLVIGRWSTESSAIGEIRQKLLIQNNMKKLAPIESFFNIFLPQEEKEILFTKKEIQSLIHLGYSFNPYAKYPLVKQTLYAGQNFKPKKKPNVILIFTEGLSAITTSVYNHEKFKGLTPALETFANDANTTIFSNYYNHTAATYRGIQGQLCSMYPWLGGGKYWIENDTFNLSKNNYKCLAHILNHNGYESLFLNMHYKESSANDEMAESFGFSHVFSGETLSRTYLGGIDKKREHYLNDHQAYEVLSRYLTQRKESNKPFFIGMYTIETHAFVDIDQEGIPYKDGSNNVLNTIHNMDDAFGKFWDVFRHSKYAENTIIIFTSDHAHYYGKEYVHMMKENNENRYHNIFIDRVPLIVYHPHYTLSKNIETRQGTSIDLAPTITNLLGVKQEENAWVGHSLFDSKHPKIGIGSYGSNSYLIKQGNLIYSNKNVLPSDKEKFSLIEKYIQYMHKLEKENMVVPKEESHSEK